MIIEIGKELSRPTTSYLLDSTDSNRSSNSFKAKKCCRALCTIKNFLIAFITAAILFTLSAFIYTQHMLSGCLAPTPINKCRLNEKAIDTYERTNSHIFTGEFAILAVALIVATVKLIK
jgi:hypothetical protein